MGSFPACQAKCRSIAYSGKTPTRASTSSECRMLFAVRYIPARVTYNRQQDESFPTFLARGSDAGGGHDDGPMKACLGDC